MAGDELRKMATARAYLSGLVMIEAPAHVVETVRQWCLELEKDLPAQKGGGWTQGMTVSDTAKVKLVDVREKN